MTPPRIAAALCWYDEPLEHLRRVVASVAPLVDSIVAFDGRWEGFPPDRYWVPQVDDMRAILKDANVTSYIVQDGSVPWTSQAEKRTALYRDAASIADWILVIDADEHLVIDDLPRLRRDMKSTSVPDAWNILVTTPGDDKSAGGGLTATAPVGPRWQPRLLRSDPSITVGPCSHRTLSTDHVLIQYGSAEDEAVIDALPARICTTSAISIVNTTHSRDALRIAAKQSYGKARHARGID